MPELSNLGQPPSDVARIAPVCRHRRPRVLGRLDGEFDDHGVVPDAFVGVAVGQVVGQELDSERPGRRDLAGRARMPNQRELVIGFAQFTRRFWANRVTRTGSPHGGPGD